MTHEMALTYALIAALILVVALHWQAAQCRCGNCEFHKHERRVAKEKAKLAKIEEQKKSAASAHEYQHKGGGWQDGDPDRFDCPEESCRRNRHTVP